MKVEEKEQIKELYFFDNEFYGSKKLRLLKVPVVKETSQSYYVPSCCFYSYEEFMEKYGKDNNFSRCFIVKKENLVAKISNCGFTHRRYYKDLSSAQDSYFVRQNARKISQALERSKNPYLLRQVAHNLEIEDLEELKFEEKENV